MGGGGELGGLGGAGVSEGEELSILLASPVVVGGGGDRGGVRIGGDSPESPSTVFPNFSPLSFSSSPDPSCCCF